MVIRESHPKLATVTGHYTTPNHGREPTTTTRSLSLPKTRTKWTRSLFFPPSTPPHEPTAHHHKKQKHPVKVGLATDSLLAGITTHLGLNAVAYKAGWEVAIQRGGTATHLA